MSGIITDNRSSAQSSGIKTAVEILRDKGAVEVISTKSIRMVVISSHKGTVIKTGYLSNQTNVTIDISGIKSGIYMIEVYYGSKHLLSVTQRTRFKQIKYIGA